MKKLGGQNFTGQKVPLSPSLSVNFTKNVHSKRKPKGRLPEGSLSEDSLTVYCGDIFQKKIEKLTCGGPFSEKK